MESGRFRGEAAKQWQGNSGKVGGKGEQRKKES